MRVQLATSTEELDRLKDAWLRIQACDSDCTVYTDFNFLRSWWIACEGDSSLSLYIVYASFSGKVIAIAPFIRVAQRRLMTVRWNELRFMGIGDSFTVMVDSTVVDCSRAFKLIFNFLEDQSDTWECIFLNNIGSHTKLAHYLRGSEKFAVAFRYATECPYVTFIDGVQDYVVDLHRLAKVRRYWKRARQELDAEFHVNTHHEADFVEQMMGLHRREQAHLRTKGHKTRRSLFDDAHVAQFVRQVYLSDGRVMTFAICQAGSGKLLGYYTCYVHGHVIHFWNQAYDPDYEVYRMGQMLALSVFEFLRESQFTGEFDFGSGAYSWKYRLARKSRPMFRLELWRKESRSKEQAIRVLTRLGVNYDITPKSFLRRLSGSIRQCQSDGEDP